MATLASSRASTKEEDEQVESSDSDKDESLCDDVKVNIAIVGKSGSGRSSFVNAILGYSSKFMYFCKDTKLVNRVTHYIEEKNTSEMLEFIPLA